MGDPSWSAMSIGEKLSLKGKLFDLSRKLSLFEVETAIQEECTFTPVTNKYSLPDRESSFEANVQRAELIKQRRQEEALARIKHENDEACTFTPTVFTRRSNVVPDNEYISKPVGDRLFEKACESQKKTADLIERRKKYDAYGNKLFSPQIPKSRRANSEAAASTAGTSGDAPPKGKSITAVEFMYRDARDREERQKMRLRAANAEAERGASSHRKNKKSVMILRQKAEREVRSVFDLLDQSEAGFLSKEDLQNGVKLLCDRDLVPPDSLYSVTEQAWGVLDKEQTGAVAFPSFLAICITFTMRETPAGSWTLDNALPSPSAAAALSTASLSFRQPPVCAVPKNEELASLRHVVRSLVSILKASPELLGAKQSPLLQSSFRSKHVKAEDTNKTPFSPVINKVSHKKALASRKKLLTDLSATTLSENASAVPSALDVLELRTRLREEKVEKKRQELQDKEAKECSFRPHLFEPMKHRKAPPRTGEGAANAADLQGSTENKEAQLPVYEKLYAYKDKQACFKSDEELLEEAKKFKVPYVRKPDSELDHCTFKPAITLYTKPSSVPAKDITPGFKEAVERVQSYRAYVAAEPVRLRLDALASEERYRQGRKMLATAVPPTFLSDERIKIKHEKRRFPQARLFVDVRLSASKVASIPIIDGDNPASIAESFCKIYALDKPAKEVLEEVVRQSMEKNGIHISEEVTGGGADALKLTRKSLLQRSTGASNDSTGESDSGSGSDSVLSSSSSTDDDSSRDGSSSSSDSSSADSDEDD